MGILDRIEEVNKMTAQQKQNHIDRNQERTRWRFYKRKKKHKTKKQIHKQIKKAHGEISKEFWDIVKNA